LYDRNDLFRSKKEKRRKKEEGERGRGGEGGEYLLSLMTGV
jgi:hypothetical protein